MSFGDIHTTTVTSGMEPFRILFDGFSWYWLTVILLADALQPLKNVTGEFFLSVAGVLDRHRDFIICLIVWLLYYLIFWFYLCSVDDTRVYIFIYKCVQTGVICWAEEGPKCNVMPAVNFFLFLRLNGSVNWS